MVDLESAIAVTDTLIARRTDDFEKLAERYIGGGCGGHVFVLWVGRALYPEVYYDRLS